MADTDISLYNLRYNQVSQKLEAQGGTPMWNALTLTNSGSSGVSSIHADSNSNLTGNVQLISGTNVTLTQSGQGITISASGGGSPTAAAQFRSTSAFSTTSETFSATGVKITGYALSGSSRHAKITVAGNFRNDSTVTGNLYATIFMDDTTNLGDSTTGLINLGLAASSQATMTVPGAMVYLAAPGDTSAHTYEVYIRGDDTDGRFFPSNNTGGTIIVEDVA